MWKSHRRLLDEEPFDRDDQRYRPEDLLGCIRQAPGLKSPYYAQYFQVSGRTIERWLRRLREDGKIEFVGSPRTGGYYLVDGESEDASEGKG